MYGEQATEVQEIELRSAGYELRNRGPEHRGVPDLAFCRNRVPPFASLENGATYSKAPSSDISHEH
ncbi:hypothetical protein AM571_CH01714 [Rhizobium etli 8C-3]|uniref:Uncharacterized protein n=1 Tax=Rhizobium etli 8C-3 TaxID=538025 RepID=A0A1L5P334_RHIET|nr:hypothetical protein AM571_CH01714 [Rhizobium etli 8C-3]